MPSLIPLAIATAAGLANVVVAGHNANYFPPKPEGLKVVESKHEEGVKISYKGVPTIDNLYYSIRTSFNLTVLLSSPKSAKPHQA